MSLLQLLNFRGLPFAEVALVPAQIVPLIFPEANEADGVVAVINGNGSNATLASFERGDEMERIEAHDVKFAAPVAVSVNKYPSYTRATYGGNLAVE